MTVKYVDALIQFTNDSGSEWIATNPVPKYYLIYDPDSNIIKKGNDIDLYDNLPIWLDLNVLESIYAKVKSKIDPLIFEDNTDHPNKLVILNKNKKLSIATISKEELTLWINTIIQIHTNEELPDSLLISSNILPPYIYGPKEYSLNRNVTLVAYSISLFGDTNDLQYEWELPNGDINHSQSITYYIPNDFHLIGTKLLFKCKAISKIGFSSVTSTFEIEVKKSELESEPYITNLEMKNVF